MEEIAALEKLRKLLTKEDKDKRKKEKQQEFGRKRAALTNTFSVVFSSGEGRKALKWIMDYCGYQIPMSAMNRQTGEILEANIIHNAALHGLYADLRKFIPANVLFDVEINPDSLQSDLFE